MASDPNNKPVFIQAMQKNNYAPAKDMGITHYLGEHSGNLNFKRKLKFNNLKECNQ